MNAYARWVRFSFGAPWRAAGLLLLICLPAAALTVSFFGRIDSRILDLLPPDAPVVRNFENIAAQMSGKTSVLVIADSPDPEVNRRFITDLERRLREHPLELVRSVRADVSAERAWAYRRVPLLIPRADFDRLTGQADAALEQARRRANPFFIQLEDEAPFDWDSIRATVREKTAAYDRFPRGFLETPDGRTVVAVLWLRGAEIDYPVSVRLMESVQREVDELRRAYPPTLRVAFNGEVVNTIEEHRAIVADLSLTSMVVLLLVGLVVALYFRSLRALGVVGLALVPGLLVTFAVGRLTVGGLNSNTAFLGSIIGGNGINYPLILLAYFRRQDVRLDAPAAFLAAARQGLPGTLGAAVTASAAYGGLALSSFRGFSQFGWLGGMGMVTVWALSFLALPVTVALLRPARAPARAGRIDRLFAMLFDRPAVAATLSAVAVLAILGGTVLGVKAGLESGLYERDFRSLRNRDSLAHGGASWDGRINEVFGVWLNPVVALAPDEEGREVLAQRLRRTLFAGEHPLAERVETLASVVPPREEQEARLTRLRRLAGPYRRGRSEVPADMREVLDRWFTPEALQAIVPEEVPRSMHDGFAEKSGRTDRVVLVYPALAIDYNDADNIIGFADHVASVDLPPGSVVGGGFLFLAEVFRMVRDQALKVIALVALLASLSLLPVLWRRPLRVLAVVATSSAVAFASQSMMLALGTRVNLLNFAAIAITIGVGSDYMVNLVAAADALGTDLAGASARMGSAILLCSATTVIGYGSLVLAGSGALRSFGWSAILGEMVACLVVLLVIPAASLMRTPGRSRSLAGGAIDAPPYHR